MKIPFSDTEEKKLVLDLAGSDCRLGELVTLNWNDALIKKSGQTSYAYCAVSNYVCVREATDSQCGILVKVLGRISKEFIMFVNGEPFCKDERDDFFRGRRYYSYPFPTVDALKEVLRIVSSNPSLMSSLQAAGMKFNAASGFWVRESSGCFLTKTPQFYDAGSAQTRKATDNTAHYRLSIAYFRKNGMNSE